MRAILTRSCAAAALVALSAPATAADRIKTVTSRHSKQSAPDAVIADSRFVLAAQPPYAKLMPQMLRPASASFVQVAQFGDGLVEYVEGPSWSYQHSHRGPVIEMGALGGGSMEDAPFLAHVALAWRF
jgi:hypothetical protein